MIVYPAIDIRGGNCVRLTKGDYNRETIYGSDPVLVAQGFVEKGAQVIHVVDLDAAKAGQPVNANLIARLVGTVAVPVQLGGGIRSEEIINQYIDLGVQRLVVGTRAAKDPDWFAEMAVKFPNRLLAGIDALGGDVATDGWIQKSGRDPVDLAKQFDSLPILGLVYTDIDTDGMLQGPNLKAMTEMAAAISTPVIASGGVTETTDVADLVKSGVAGCIVGRSLYEGRMTLEQALQAADSQI